MLFGVDFWVVYPFDPPPAARNILERQHFLGVELVIGHPLDWMPFQSTAYYSAYLDNPSILFD